MRLEIVFDVAGLPAPQGSKTAFVHKATGRAIMRDVRGGELRSWRESVRWGFLSAVSADERGAWTSDPKAPVGVRVTFRFPRPAGHYGSGRNASTLKPSAPEDHVHSPDLDKLLRGILDALTGVAYADDRQVHIIIALRRYCRPGEPPGARVQVRTRG